MSEENLIDYLRRIALLSDGENTFPEVIAKINAGVLDEHDWWVIGSEDDDELR